MEAKYNLFNGADELVLIETWMIFVVASRPEFGVMPPLRIYQEFRRALLKKNLPV